MTTKKKTKAPSEQDTQTLEVKDQKDKSKARKLAEVQLCPTYLIPQQCNRIPKC